jgi:hypothetical protein
LKTNGQTWSLALAAAAVLLALAPENVAPRRADAVAACTPAPSAEPRVLE